MKLSAAARSDVGMRRTANEDAYALAPALGLYLVADGMGGHVAGQLASRLAAESTVEALQRVAERSATLTEKLRYCVAAANHRVHATARAKPELEGMGTTLVALLAGGGRLALAHVGDSRIYLFRDGQAFKILWSTENRAWEKQTGLVRPMHFVDSQGNLIPLHPGRTWLHLVTPFSSVTDQGDGSWLVQFVQPYDPEDPPEP